MLARHAIRAVILLLVTKVCNESYYSPFRRAQNNLKFDTPPWSPSLSSTVRMSRKVEDTIETTTTTTTTTTKDANRSETPASSDREDDEDFHDAKIFPSQTPSPRGVNTPMSSTTVLEDESPLNDQVTSKLVFAFGPFKRHFFDSGGPGGWNSMYGALPFPSTLLTITAGPDQTDMPMTTPFSQ